MTSQPRRKSLADRNREAIQRDPIEHTPPIRPERRARTTTTDTTRVSVSMSPDEFTGVKAAFIADWQHARQHDTFPAWISAALEHHAILSPTQRSALAGDGPKGKSPRSFVIPNIVGDQIRDALAADARHGAFLTMSAWCHNALMAGVATARGKNDGVLPTPPSRLPIRLA
ncbi:MAG: hypothetical protein Q4G35_02430 [Propionibacteriaceae bacterium]|nr:hypothetical protein [Propionibacteriaceae bacterium]